MEALAINNKRKRAAEDHGNGNLKKVKLEAEEEWRTKLLKSCTHWNQDDVQSPKNYQISITKDEAMGRALQVAIFYVKDETGETPTP